MIVPKSPDVQYFCQTGETTMGIKAYLHDNVYALVLWIFDLLNELDNVAVSKRLEDRSAWSDASP